MKLFVGITSVVGRLLKVLLIGVVASTRNIYPQSIRYHKQPSNRINPDFHPFEAVDSAILHDI